MLRPLKLFLAIFSATVLQFSVMPAILEDPFKPNLMMIVVCYLALQPGAPLTGALISYFCGLLVGSFSGYHFGLSGISYLLIYLLLNRLSDQLYTESVSLITVAVFIASVIDAVVIILLSSLFSYESSFSLSVLGHMFPLALMSALFAYLFFSALNLYRKRFAA